MTLTEDLFTAINSKFHGSRYQIAGIIGALYADKPVLLLGPPGSGKTYILSQIANVFSGNVYYRLLSQFTTPEELFGVPDLNAYEKGIFRRILDFTLIDSRNAVALLDEAFRASSAVRNSLLDIMANHRFPNGREMVPVKTRITFASNFLSDDPEDQAFIDRLSFIFVPSAPLGRIEPVNMYRQMVLIKSVARPPATEKHTLEELEEKRALIEEKKTELVRKYSSTIPVIVAEVEQMFGIRFSNRRMIHMIEMGLAVKHIAEEISGKTFRYKSAEDLVRDIVYTGALYYAPRSQEDLFETEAERKRSRYHRLTKTAPKMPIIEKVKDVTELFEFVNRAFDYLFAKNVTSAREFVGPQLSEGNMAELFMSLVRDVLPLYTEEKQHEILGAARRVASKLLLGQYPEKELRVLWKTLGVSV